MPINLTGTTPSATYSQLLHINEGPTATEKFVRSGTGVPTALRLGTESASVGNVQFAGNTVRATDGNLIIGEELEFEDAAAARQALGITVLPFAPAVGTFYDPAVTDVTGSVTNRNAIAWSASGIPPVGVSVVSQSRITLAAAGTYRVNASLQFFNTTNSTRTVDLWFGKNGVDIPNSGARITVPAGNLGGTNLVAYEILENVAAGDYIEMYWHPSNVSAVLHYLPPVTGVVDVTPSIPAIPPAIVVVQRVA
jgi:hypothetical protein